MSYMKAIHEILEEVREDICDNYCKYEDVIKNVHMTDEEYDKWIEEHCEKCPLNKL